MSVAGIINCEFLVMTRCCAFVRQADIQHVTVLHVNVSALHVIVEHVLILYV